MPSKSRRFARKETTRTLRRGHLELLESRQLLAAFSFEELGNYLADSVLQGIQENVGSAAFDDFSMPLVGDKLPGNVQLFSEQLRDDLKDGLAALDDLDQTIEEAEQGLQQVLNDILSTEHQVVVGNIQIAESFDPETGDVQIQVQFARDVFEVPLIDVDKQLGIPFLPIEVGADVNLSAGLSFEFATMTVGYNVGDEQFFYEFDEAGPELTMTLAASLGGSSFQANFGLFGGVTVTDEGSGATAQFIVDIDSEGGIQVAPVEPNIAIHLGVEAEVSQYLPSIAFSLDWEVTGDTWDGSGVQINDVQVGLGGVIDTMLGPVIDLLQPIIDPVAKVTGKITAPLPVISDVANQDISLMDVIQWAADAADIPQEYQAIIDAAEALITVLNTLDQFDCDEGNEGCYLNLGDFDLAGNGNLNDDAKQAMTLTELQEVEAGSLDKLSDLDAGVLPGFDVLALAGNIQSFLTDHGLGDLGDAVYETFVQLSNGVDISFPVFENPKSLVNLLLGNPQDVEIFRFNAIVVVSEPMDYENSFQTPFVSGLYAGLHFNLDPVVNFQLGYDALGIYNAIKYQEPSRWADGFWIAQAAPGLDDPEVSGMTVASLGANVEATVGGTFFGVLHAGISGGVSADLALAIPEPEHGDQDGNDQKIRLTNELGPTLFNVNGGISGEVEVEFKAGFKAFGKCFCVGKEITLASKDFVTFQIDAIPNPFDTIGVENANLAVHDETTGELVLSMGTFREAHDRQVKPDVVDEQFLVFMQDTADGPQLVVSFGGVNQVVAGAGTDYALDDVTSIYASAGDGADRVVIAAGVPYNASLRGGDGNDELIYLGSGSAYLNGEVGDDVLYSQGIVNILSGEEGHDHLTGSSHELATFNSMDGGTGNDVLIGGSGQNFLQGGDGQDELYGGDGPSTLAGGGGFDVLFGGLGDANFFGGEGNDRYYAGAGLNVVTETTGELDQDEVFWTVEDGDLYVDAQEGAMSVALLGGDSDETFHVRNTIADPVFDLEVEVDGEVRVWTHGVENLSVDGAAGADEVYLHPLLSSSLEQVALNGTDKLLVDGAEDNVYVEATSASDQLTLSAHDVIIHEFVQTTDNGVIENTVFGGAMVLTGLPYTVSAMVNPEDYYRLDTFGGHDNVSVYGATGTLHLNTDGGNDTAIFYVDETGNDDPSLPTPRPEYDAPVQYNAGGGVNNLIVTAERSAIADTLELTSETASSERIDVHYTGDAFSVVRLTGSQSHDEFHVLSTRTAFNIVQGDDGNDTVHVGQSGSLDSISGSLLFDGQGGDDHLVLDDRAAGSGNADVVIGPAVVTGLAGPNDGTTVGYLSSSVEVLGSDRPTLAEVFHLNGPGATATIRAGQGDDRLLVHQLNHLAAFYGEEGDDLVTLGGDLNLVTNTLAVFGGDDDDRVEIDDHAAAVAQSYVLTANSLHRGAATVQFDPTLETLDLQGTPWNDQVQIKADPLAGQVELNLREGADAILGPDAPSEWSIYSVNEGTLGGDVHFHAETVQGGDAEDHFIVEEGAEIAGIFGGAGDADDTVELAHVADATVDLQTRTINGLVTFHEMERIVGGDGDDTLRGDAFNNIWRVNALDGGHVSTGWGGIEYASFENLVGGDLRDSYVMQPTGRVSGDVDGAGGDDRLSYAFYQTSVYIDLTTGRATGIAGEVRNVEHAYGGAGDDILVGNHLANQLVGLGGNDLLVGRGGDDRLYGTSGRDLLIGGAGADSLAGGGGDDLLIGGRTRFDGSLKGLDLIMAEWAREDLPVAERVANLQQGGGLNGRTVLSNNTVIRDNAIDSVFGGSGADFWLFDLEDVALDAIELSAPVGA